jgi:hypothetical protein
MESQMTENFKTTLCYTIDDIANWQKEVQENTYRSTISLPNLQRGFVWKPYQIESLWDSILRAYPIGALLINETENRSKELLDGQQRCTSISIGYLNPYKTDKTTKLLNIQKNIPSVWIDLKPVMDSPFGVKFGLRVLTRSHPWGYQLKNNRKPLSASDREKALLFFREKVKDEKKSFSSFSHTEINPWDAHYPIPLFKLLTSDFKNFEVWKKEVDHFIDNNLKGKIKTKYSGGDFVEYSMIKSDYFRRIFDAILEAKKMLIPEILVHQKVLKEKEEHVYEDSDEATLFVRLNSEGTIVSGEELIYSLLKSILPEAKELVEDIDVKYIAPSKILNLFARLTQIELKGDSSTYQKNMSLVGFRRAFSTKDFKKQLIAYIEKKENGNSKAKQLFDAAIEIVAFEQKLPKIYIKNQISKSLDLFFVLLVYLHKNEGLCDIEKNKIHKDFHSLALFNENQKKTARALFKNLNEDQFQNWEESVKKLRKEQPYLAFPLIKSSDFKEVQNLILTKYLEKRGLPFHNRDFVRNIFKDHLTKISFLEYNKTKKEEETDEDFNNRQLDAATNHWLDFANKIYWDKTFLILAQDSYFNSQFEDYMAFDDIEDTNRPWDWDHIYPNSWVYNKTGISRLVKHIVNTNGNFRALSFNENRSQSNHQSPHIRFSDNRNAQKKSFIKENDLEHWMKLTNSDNRLKDSEKYKDKIDALVRASFYRMNNIYEHIYNFLKH